MLPRKWPVPDSPGVAGNALWGCLTESEDSPVGEVAHSSAALALALCRAGPGFPSSSSNRVSGRSSWCAVPLGQSGPAPGVTPRWHALLSWSEDSIRKPAQHKAGSSRARGGTRLNGRFRGSRPSRGRKRWNGSKPIRLQEWRVRHAPARAKSPGVGKVLRKVPIDPARVNLRKRIDRDVKPRGADSRTRFRTREGGLGLTGVLTEFFG